MKTLSFLFVLLITAAAALAQPSPSGPYSLTFGWNASTSPAITNYQIWWGPSSRTYTNAVSVGTNLTGVVSNLTRGPVYFFAATCTDTNALTSDYSNEVSTNKPAPPNPATNLKIP